MVSLKIIPYHPGLAERFKELNLAWLKAYFYVEPKDEVLLGNCEESILNKGGYIFFGELDEIVVGCFSFLQLGDRIYELGKMAVDEKYQGLKIGQALLGYAIDFATEQQWKSIILYSSRKLHTALHIYAKFGFKEVEMDPIPPYARGDIKMRLDLDGAYNQDGLMKTHLSHH